MVSLYFAVRGVAEEVIGLPNVPVTYGFISVV